jgi:hypothetical protein
MKKKKNIHRKNTNNTFTFTIYIYIHITNYKNSKLNKNYIKQFKIYKIAPKKSRNCKEGLLKLRE